MNELYLLLISSLATASISVTISKSELLETPREWIENSSKWLGKLFNCPYCISHWVAIVLCSIMQPVLLSNQRLWVNAILFIFSIVTLSSFWSGLIFKSIDYLSTPDLADLFNENFKDED